MYVYNPSAYLLYLWCRGQLCNYLLPQKQQLAVPSAYLLCLCCRVQLCDYLLPLKQQLFPLPTCCICAVEYNSVISCSPRSNSCSLAVLPQASHLYSLPNQALAGQSFYIFQSAIIFLYYFNGTQIHLLDATITVHAILLMYVLESTKVCDSIKFQS